MGQRKDFYKTTHQSCVCGAGPISSRRYLFAEMGMAKHALIPRSVFLSTSVTVRVRKPARHRERSGEAGGPVAVTAKVTLK